MADRDETVTLTVDDASTEERLTLAGRLLERCAGIVVLKGVVRLLPGPDEIECAVIAPMAGYARCEEEYQVMAENAARALAASRLGRVLPDRPLRWTVAADDTHGRVELWRAP